MHWSPSLQADLESCPQRAWLRTVGGAGGWMEEAPVEIKRVWAAGKSVSLHELQRRLLRKAISGYLRSLQDGQRLFHPDDLVDLVQHRFREAVRASMNRTAVPSETLTSDLRSPKEIPDPSEVEELACTLGDALGAWLEGVFGSLAALGPQRWWVVDPLTSFSFDDIDVYGGPWLVVWNDREVQLLSYTMGRRIWPPHPTLATWWELAVLAGCGPREIRRASAATIQLPSLQSSPEVTIHRHPATEGRQIIQQVVRAIEDLPTDPELRRPLTPEACIRCRFSHCCELSGAPIRHLQPAKWHPGTKLHVQAVQQAVSEVFGVSVEQILGARMHREVVVARMVCQAILRWDGNLTFPKLGRIFSRDHSSVQHGVKSIQRRLATDPLLRDQVLDVIDKVHGPFSDSGSARHLSTIPFTSSSEE